MTDFTSGYTNLLRKQWRALVYDYDAMQDGIGETSKLYCLTNFQVMFLQDNVDYMRWVTRWNNLSIDSNSLGQLADELELALMTCIEIYPYMLQFNYDSEVDALLNNYDILYDLGGIAGLNANTPTDFFQGDGSTDRDNALCTASNIYVRSYAQNWITKAEVALGVAIITSVLVSISIVGGIIAGTVLAGLALITQTALDAFKDDDAIDNVVCCMIAGLDGLAVNQANFETAFDSCGFTVGTNEAIIRDIIASDIDQWNNYLSFLNALGDAYVLAQAGVVSCPDCTLEVIRLNGNGNAQCAVLIWGAAPPYDTPIGYYDIPTDSYVGGQSTGQDYALLNVTYTFPSAVTIKNVSLSSSLSVTRDLAGSSFELLVDGVQQFTELLAFDPTPHLYGIDESMSLVGTVVQFKFACGGSAGSNAGVQLAPIIIEYE
jgi:hypothetical protein